MIAPCPFCGAQMLASYTGAGGAFNGFVHPDSLDCFRSGRVFTGKNLIPKWNKRAPTIFYEVEDGHPLFNGEGRGAPVTPAMLNDFIRWYKENSQ